MAQWFFGLHGEGSKSESDAFFAAWHQLCVNHGRQPWALGPDPSIRTAQRWRLAPGDVLGVLVPR